MKFKRKKGGREGRRREWRDGNEVGMRREAETCICDGGKGRVGE